jgi:hypothetical protein
MLRRHLPSLSFVAVLTTLVAIGAAVFIYLGVYDVAADQPHTRPVFALLETPRDRSITVRARGIKPPPDLDAPERVRIGADFTVRCALAVTSVQALSKAR